MPLTQVQGQMLNGSNNTTTTIQSNGTTAITIDSTQNVGIGNTVASIINAANGVGNLVVGSGSGSEGITIYTGTTDTGGIAFAKGTTTTDTYRGYINYVHSTDHMAFWTAATERMRIDSSGRVGIATNSPAAYGQLAVRAGVNGTYFGITANSTLSVSDATNSTLAVLHNNSNSGTSFIGTDAGGRLQLFCSSTAAGGVYLANGGTSWTSASDERVKENLEPIQNGLEKVTSLRAVTGNYIADETKKSKAFLIAQDVEAVLPEAVDSSNPDELGLAYTDVIPLLVASIKELKAELDATKAEVAELKAKGQ